MSAHNDERGFQRSRLHKSSRGLVVGVDIYDIHFDVEYDPNLEHRGITIYEPNPVIKLREWDSEVFLHECIHVAFATQPPRQEGEGAAWWLARNFIGNLLLTDRNQEVFVQHLSHFLDDIGFELKSKTREEVTA